MVAWYTYLHPCFSKLGSRNASQLTKAGYGTLAWIYGGLDPANNRAPHGGGINNIVQDYKSLFWKAHSILLCMRSLLSAAKQLSIAGYGTLACINGGLDPAKNNIVQDYKSLFWKDHSILLCMRRLLSVAEQLSQAGYGTLAWIMAAWAQPRRQTCPSRALPTDNFVAPAR